MSDQDNKGGTMAESMVTGRIDAGKKARVGQILQQNGMNASQAINLLYDKIEQTGNCNFLSKAPSVSANAETWKRATDYVDSLLPDSVQSNNHGELPDCFAKEENRNIPNLKLLVSTDILDAFFFGKGRKHKEARAVLVAGCTGALRLWVTPFQIIEMHRKATPKIDSQNARKAIQGLLSFIHVQEIGEREIERALYSSPEDFNAGLFFEAAISLKADAVLSSKTLEFEQPCLQQMSCSDLLKITQKTE